MMARIEVMKNRSGGVTSWLVKGGGVKVGSLPGDLTKQQAEQAAAELYTPEVAYRFPCGTIVQWAGATLEQMWGCVTDDPPGHLDRIEMLRRYTKMGDINRVWKVWDRYDYMAHMRRFIPEARGHSEWNAYIYAKELGYRAGDLHGHPSGENEVRKERLRNFPLQLVDGVWELTHG